MVLGAAAFFGVPAQSVKTPRPHIDFWHLGTVVHHQSCASWTYEIISGRTYQQAPNIQRHFGNSGASDETAPHVQLLARNWGREGLGSRSSQDLHTRLSLFYPTLTL